MSCCCKTTTTKNNRRECPECGRACLAVSMQTMLHQVRSPENSPENRSIPEDKYAYCPDPDCSMGYFSAAHLIPKEKLRVFDQGQNALLCHCFDIQVSAYRSALVANEAEPIKDFIVQQTKSGACACASRSPSGRCCLADLSRLESKHA